MENKDWTMSKDTLKRLIQAAQWCIEKSEAFEKAHPIAPADKTAWGSEESDKHIESEVYYDRS